MLLRATFVAHVGTDAVLDVEGAPFVLPDPKLRLKGTSRLEFSLDADKPSSAGIFQGRYRARPSLGLPGLYIFEDEGRTTKNVLRVPPGDRPPVVYVTLTPDRAPVDLSIPDFSDDGLPCLPDCDPLEIHCSYLENRG